VRFAEKGHSLVISQCAKNRRVRGRNGRDHRGLHFIVVGALALFIFINSSSAASNTFSKRSREHWIGTWAASPQPASKARLQTYQNQTLRLIVHTSAGGRKVRIKISNIFADQPLVIGSAHVARRSGGPNIDPASDRALRFGGHASTTIAAGSMVVSDPVDLDLAPLSDLAISLFFPNATVVTTAHALALQTNYVSSKLGDVTSTANFPFGKTIASWPFLTGVDVLTSPNGASIVALGSSTTDGDGSTRDTNHRWPDFLAERLQKAGHKHLGVLNEGIIGNRLLSDSQSPSQAGGPPPLGPVFEQLGPVLGPSGMARFQRDVLAQAGVKYLVLNLGVNDILFPGSFIPASETVTSKAIISGNRELISRAHKAGITVIGATIPPFEHALFRDPFFDRFYTPENDRIREEVNDWIRKTGEFDAVVDLDMAVRDPSRPSQLLPAYDSGDHLHVNDAGNAAQADAFRLELFK
jgi:lysophospholipase L1-like esterase